MSCIDSHSHPLTDLSPPSALFRSRFTPSRQSGDRKQRLIRLLALLAVACLASPILGLQAPEQDLLDLGAGAALVSASSEYSTNWKAQWSALALLDGTRALGWCSAEGAPFPHEFVVELAGRQRLETVTLHNPDRQEASNPGISAREVEIQTSTQGPETGFAMAAKGEVERGGSSTLSLPATPEARWIKIVIRSNWGHATYTELMELEATGKPVGDNAPASALTGVYEGQYEGRTLRTVLAQRGADLAGCYTGSGEGRLAGHAAGRSAELEWRQPNDGGAGRNGSLLLVASDAGVLSGLWYGRDSKADKIGRWTGRRVDGNNRVAEECPAVDLATTLEQAGTATLYGIRFTSDSAELTAEAEPTLRRLHELLTSAPELALRIAGHTDAQASERHNQDLSQRRAEAVRAWLVDRGVAAERLVAIGFGESQPIADNATPQGRRLNRRVEVSPL